MFGITFARAISRALQTRLAASRPAATTAPGDRPDIVHDLAATASAANAPIPERCGTGWPASAEARAYGELGASPAPVSIRTATPRRLVWRTHGSPPEWVAAA